MLTVVLASFLAGMVVRRLAGASDRWTRGLDRYVLTVALPALVVSKMSRAEFGTDVVVPVVVAWTAIIGSATVIIVVGRMANWDANVVGAVLMVGVLGNTSFLGLGVVEGLLGPGHVPSAIAYDQLGTFLALSTYGSWVVGRYGIGETGWRPVALRLLRFGPFIALLASPVVALLHPPASAYRALDVPAMTVAPVAMFALGWRFTVGHVRGRSRIVVAGLAWKMAVVPLIVVSVAALTASPTDVAWSASVLQAAAPPMVTAGAVAVAAGLDATVVTVTVGVGTLTSFVTLPLWSVVVR